MAPKITQGNQNIIINEQQCKRFTGNRLRICSSSQEQIKPAVWGCERTERRQRNHRPSTSESPKITSSWLDQTGFLHLSIPQSPTSTSDIKPHRVDQSCCHANGKAFISLHAQPPVSHAAVPRQKPLSARSPHKDRSTKVFLKPFIRLKTAR